MNPNRELEFGSVHVSQFPFPGMRKRVNLNGVVLQFGILRSDFKKILKTNPFWISFVGIFFENHL